MAIPSAWNEEISLEGQTGLHGQAVVVDFGQTFQFGAYDEIGRSFGAMTADKLLMLSLSSENRQPRSRPSILVEMVFSR